MAAGRRPVPAAALAASPAQCHRDRGAGALDGRKRPGRVGPTVARHPATAATPNASCEPVIALLDRVQSQPPARRELAERLFFHGAH